MGFALHALHLAILVVGGLGVWLMLRPTVTSGRTVAGLRRQAQQGTLAEAALRRAVLTERLPAARSTRSVRLLHSYAVAGACVAAAVLAEWTIGIRVAWWALAFVAVVAFAAAAVFLARPRPVEHVLIAAVLGEWLVHAVLVTTSSVGSGGSVSRVFSAVLFCHPVGTAAPRVTVLGYVVRPAAGGATGSALGLLALGSACLATACVAGLCNRHTTRAAWRRVQAGVVRPRAAVALP